MLIVHWRQTLEIGDQRPEVLVANVIENRRWHVNQSSIIMTHTMADGPHPIFVCVVGAYTACTGCQIWNRERYHDRCTGSLTGQVLQVTMPAHVDGGDMLAARNRGLVCGDGKG